MHFILCSIIMDLMFGLFLQQFAITVRIEKYVSHLKNVWHLKNLCVVLDGQGKAVQKV